MEGFTIHPDQRIRAAMAIKRQADCDQNACCYPNTRRIVSKADQEGGKNDQNLIARDLHGSSVNVKEAYIVEKAAPPLKLDADGEEQLPSLAFGIASECSFRLKAKVDRPRDRFGVLLAPSAGWPPTTSQIEVP